MCPGASGDTPAQVLGTPPSSALETWGPPVVGSRRVVAPGGGAFL